MDYDEDLNSNPFLKFIQEHYGFLYEEAVRKQWILCIPSAKSLCKNSLFDELYVRQHLILQDGDTSRTLANDPVQIKDNWLKFGATTVRILFQETFYTKLGKVRALCIHNEETPLKAIKSPNSLQKKSIRNSIRTVKKMLSSTKLEQEFGNFDEVRRCLAEIKLYMSTLHKKISACVLHNVYDELMDLIQYQASKTDAALNKIRRNNYEISLKDLSIPEDFSSGIEDALTELGRMAEKRLVADKLDCLRKTVEFLTKTNVRTELDADSLLTLLSFLIIKSHVTSWTAQLDFINYFHNANLLGEDGYLISTLEAVLDHIKQTSFTTEVDLRRFPDQPLLAAARNGDTDALTELLYSAKFKCHPLCCCQSCGLPMVVDALGTDTHGWTALHYACYFGHSDVTQVLLKTCFGDNFETPDLQGRTALHLAAFRGFQTCLLLLCHQAGSNLNTRDFQGNSALHLAVLNGHDSCVKALLYYSEQAHIRLEIDAVNNDGETALHLASKWGYCSIVKLLLQWEVECGIVNKNQKTAADVAQNFKIAETISKYNDFDNTVKAKNGGSKFWAGITRQLSLRRQPIQPN